MKSSTLVGLAGGAAALAAATPVDNSVSLDASGAPTGSRALGAAQRSASVLPPAIQTGLLPRGKATASRRSADGKWTASGTGFPVTSSSSVKMSTGSWSTSGSVRRAGPSATLEARRGTTYYDDGSGRYEPNDSCPIITVPGVPQTGNRIWDTKDGRCLTDQLILAQQEKDRQDAYNNWRNMTIALSSIFGTIGLGVIGTGAYYCARNCRTTRPTKRSATRRAADEWQQ